MFNTEEYDHLMFTQKFSSSDYLFYYADGDNNVVGFIQTTKDSADTPEACMPDEDVVYTTGYDMLDSMELNILIYVMTLIISVGGNIKWMMTLTLFLVPLNKILKLKYIYGSMNQPMAQNISLRVTTMFIYHIMSDRGGLFRAKLI